MAILRGERVDTRQLLSDNMQVIATALGAAIEEDRNSKAKEKARTGKRYYEYRHDILDNRIFYVDDNNVIREDTHASNVKIPHAFFTEQVDQKVQYLLSNPIEVKTDDEAFQSLLISIHALTRSATTVAALLIHLPSISIHALTRSATRRSR